MLQTPPVVSVNMGVIYHYNDHYINMPLNHNKLYTIQYYILENKNLGYFIFVSRLHFTNANISVQSNRKRYGGKMRHQRFVLTPTKKKPAYHPLFQQKSTNGQTQHLFSFVTEK